MPAIALKDDSKQLAAFLLLEGDAPVAACKARTCIFMVPPLPLASLVRDVFSQLKLKEFTVAIDANEEYFHVSGSVNATEVFELIIAGGGTGTWNVSRDGIVAASGTCEFAQ
jgi:hypothetical protein